MCLKKRQALSTVNVFRLHFLYQSTTIQKTQFTQKTEKWKKKIEKKSGLHLSTVNLSLTPADWMNGQQHLQDKITA